MTTEEPTDRELWSRAAFGELFDRHAKAVYNHCFRLTASWSAAEDHTQSTFLLAWRKRDKVVLRHGSALPWLLTVATNVVRGERRSVARRLRLAQRTPVEHPTAAQPAGSAGAVRVVRGVLHRRGGHAGHRGGQRARQGQQGQEPACRAAR